VKPPLLRSNTYTTVIMSKNKKAETKTKNEVGKRRLETPTGQLVPEDEKRERKTKRKRWVTWIG